jgi:phosphoribosylformimino-5-aminoimidazole carboxamide ribotide isomerase
MSIYSKPPSYYAEVYRENALIGGHIIKLGPNNDEAAREALSAWPGGMQVGGGINDTNAQEWLDAGTEKVSSGSEKTSVNADEYEKLIITSWLFPNAIFDEERLSLLSQKVGKENLVVDIRYVTLCICSGLIMRD